MLMRCLQMTTRSVCMAARQHSQRQQGIPQTHYVAAMRRYVTAWNNLGDAFEKATKIKDAFNSYSEALSYAPDNKIASARVQALRTKLDRYTA